MYTDDPTRDANNYYEEQEEKAHERIAKAPECCICHRKIIDGYAYVLNKYENVFAHGKCVKNEMKKSIPFSQMRWKRDCGIISQTQRSYNLDPQKGAVNNTASFFCKFAIYPFLTKNTTIRS